jgi:hypothetical protein
LEQAAGRVEFENKAFRTRLLGFSQDALDKAGCHRCDGFILYGNA